MGSIIPNGRNADLGIFPFGVVTPLKVREIRKLICLPELAVEPTVPDPNSIFADDRSFSPRPCSLSYEISLEFRQFTLLEKEGPVDRFPDPEV